jgi:hypothetical protein
MLSRIRTLDGIYLPMQLTNWLLVEVALLLIGLTKISLTKSRARICKSLRSPGIDSQPGRPVRQPYLAYQHVRINRLAESIPWNRILGSLNVYKIGISFDHPAVFLVQRA